MSLLVAVALMMLGTGLFSTFIALRSDLEGFSSNVIGLIMSAYYAGLAIGTFHCVPLVNRVGHIRAFAAFAAVASSSILLFALLLHPVAWMALRALLGFSVAGLFIVVESWLNSRTTSAQRGTVLSVYMMVSYVGMTGGQFMINIGDPSGTQLFLLSSMLVTLALVPVAITRSTHPDPVDAPRFRFNRLYHASPTAVVGCVICGLISGGFFGLGPLYARGLGFGVDQIALFMGIAIAGGFAFQFPIGRLSDRFDRRRVIFGVAIGIVAFGAVLSIGPSLPRSALFATVAVYGGLLSTLYPLCVAYANDYLEAQDVVPAAGGFVLAYGIGASVGPTVGGAVMNLAGPGGLFMAAAVFATGLVGFIVHRMRVRAWAPVVPKDRYVPLPEATVATVYSEIDPRAEVDEMYDLSVLEAGPPAAGTSGTADGPASPAAATERAKPAGDQS